MNFLNKLERTESHQSFEFQKNIIEINKEFLSNKSLLEFGVYTGNSLRRFSNFYDNFGIKKIFFGFDSFKGLPEEKLDSNNPGYWDAGAFSGVSEEQVKNSLPFVNLKSGWFEDTLNQQTLEEIIKHKVGLIHIDCDIYTSTKQVLKWLVTNNLLEDGTIIIYDDWGGHYDKKVGEFECGEGKAHKEICQEYNLIFDFIGCFVIVPEYHEICVFKYKAK